MIYLSSPQYAGLGDWWNPLDWGSAAWDKIKSAYKDLTKVPGWAWDGAKWVYGKIDSCTLIVGPMSFIPGAEDWIRKGFAYVTSVIPSGARPCDPVARAVAIAAFTAYISANTGMPPQLSSFIASVGAGVVFDCICARGGQISAPTTPPPTKPPVSPVVPIAVGAGIVGLYLLLR